jgi:hypothetical protein
MIRLPRVETGSRVRGFRRWSTAYRPPALADLATAMAGSLAAERADGES